MRIKWITETIQLQNSSEYMILEHRYERQLDDTGDHEHRDKILKAMMVMIESLGNAKSNDSIADMRQGYLNKLKPCISKYIEKAPFTVLTERTYCWCQRLEIVFAVMLAKSSSYKSCLEPFNLSIDLTFTIKHPSRSYKVRAFGEYKFLQGNILY